MSDAGRALISETSWVCGICGSRPHQIRVLTVSPEQPQVPSLTAKEALQRGVDGQLEDAGEKPPDNVASKALKGVSSGWM